MYKFRSGNERGTTKASWLNSYHSFSFNEYQSHEHMSFSDLRVINDDTVAPDSGFEMHMHKDMEIITVILSGALQHQDNVGNETVLYADSVQRITAGTGIFHSEVNPSILEPVHLLQIWIFPDKKNLTPEYEQKEFKPEVRANRLCLIVSPDGRDNSVRINQDAEIYQTNLDAGKKIKYELNENRKTWIQVAEGEIELNSQILKAGDALAIIDEKCIIEIKGIDEKSDFLIFNLRK